MVTYLTLYNDDTVTTFDAVLRVVYGSTSRARNPTAAFTTDEIQDIRSGS